MLIKQNEQQLFSSKCIRNFNQILRKLQRKRDQMLFPWIAVAQLFEVGSSRHKISTIAEEADDYVSDNKHHILQPSRG